jgi:DNA-binding NtrC family response regulator
MSTEPFSGNAGGRPPTGQQGISVLINHCAGADVAPLTIDRPVVVGRGEPSDLRIPDPKLSREHARFTLMDGRIIVEDLGSTNGTWIAQERIERAEIEFGTEVIMGTAIARVVALGVAGAPILVGEESFRQKLHEEAEFPQHLRRSFAILAVRSGVREGQHAQIGTWASHLEGKLPHTSRVNVSTPGTALVLLPETDSAAALRVAHNLALDRRDEGAQYLVGVSVYPQSASTPEALIQLAREAVGRASVQDPVISAPTAVWAESTVASGPATIIKNAEMRELYSRAAQVAHSRISVLIRGDTGTGKEVLAQFIHDRGPRSGRRMVRVNCGAISLSLVESTLFGHEKGSFSGAVKQQKGFFEDANKGTIFLDEIGELPLDAQKALLRVLENKSFSRVGSTHEIAVDVRVIAATNRNLEAMVKEGRFREDLYFRLNKLEFEIPPLCKRRDEIIPFAQHFIREVCKAEGRSLLGLPKETVKLLEAYSWPGNVRELYGVIEEAVVLARGELIQPENLRPRVRRALSEASTALNGPQPAQPAAATTAGVPAGGMKARRRQVEEQSVKEALQKANWKQAEAAKELEISLSTLKRRMKRFGLKPPKK